MQMKGRYADGEEHRPHTHRRVLYCPDKTEKGALNQLERKRIHEFLQLIRLCSDIICPVYRAGSIDIMVENTGG